MDGINCCLEIQWEKSLLMSLKGGFLRTISFQGIPSPGRRAPVWTFNNIFPECFLIQCQFVTQEVQTLSCRRMNDKTFNIWAPVVANISQAHIPPYHSSFWCTQIFKGYLEVHRLHCNYNYCEASKYKH